MTTGPDRDHGQIGYDHGRRGPVSRGIGNWSRWSEWIAPAVTVVELAAMAGVLTRMHRAVPVLGVAFGLAAVVVVVAGFWLIGLRRRLFPGRSMMQATREAAAGLPRLRRGGPFGSSAEAERLARWHLANNAEMLWAGATVVGLLATQVGDDVRGAGVQPGTVVWAALLVVVVGLFVVALWSSVRLRRTVATLPAR